MPTKPTLESILAETTPQLTEVESTRLLAQVVAARSVAKVASPYQFNIFVFKPMSYLALVLVLLLGAGGTVAASGSAKPGDLLFPIDRATEEVRLALASDAQKAALQNQFITERFAELQAILNEEKVATGTVSATDGALLNASSSLLAASSTLQFTAKVFTDDTVIQTTIGSSTPVFFTTTASSTEAIVASVVDRYGVPVSFVIAHITIADQHRPSTPSDSGGTTVRASGESRVANAVAVLALQLAAQTDSTKREAYLKTLMNEVSAVRVSGRDDAPLRLDATRVKIENDTTEVRTPNERVRIEQKDGQVEIRVDHRGSGHSESENDDRDHSVSATRTSVSTTSTEVHESEDRMDESEHSDDEDRVSFRNLNSSATASTTFISGRHGGRGNDDNNQELHGARHGGDDSRSEDGRDN